MVSIREKNMAARRTQILRHAGLIVGRHGFNALRIRDLAAQSGVSVPTVYNLIGGKEVILRAIIEDLVSQLQSLQSVDQIMPIEESVEVRVTRISELLATDEDYYRAAFLAGDRSGLFGRHSDSGIFTSSVASLIDDCKRAVKARVLHGHITPKQLGQQIYGRYRLARQDWTNGYLDLDEFAEQALTGALVCLAADAKPALKKRLISRLKRLR